MGASFLLWARACTHIVILVVPHQHVLVVGAVAWAAVLCDVRVHAEPLLFRDLVRPRREQLLRTILHRRTVAMSLPRGPYAARVLVELDVLARPLPAVGDRVPRRRVHGRRPTLDGGVRHVLWSKPGLQVDRIAEKRNDAS